MKQEYLFECEECGVQFCLGKDIKVNYAVPFKARDGRLIFITYYNCPKCGKRHYVQIDDTRSNQMKKEVSKMFKKLSKKRLDFKDIPRNQNEKFKKLNKKLEDYRFSLKKMYNGQILWAVDGSKEKAEVHFSM